MSFRNVWRRQSLAILIGAFSCGLVQASFTPTDEGQCLDWTRTDQYQEFRALEGKIDAAHRSGYDDCRLRWSGRSNPEWFRCQNLADSSYLKNARSKDQREKAARSVYENERKQCVSVARQNKQAIEDNHKRAKAQEEAQRHAIKQQAEQQKRMFGAEMARGQADRDAYNRAAVERNRQAQQQWQASQIRAQQTAAAQAEQQRRIEADRAARIRRIDEQQQAISNAQMDLMNYSNANAERALASSRAKTAEMASAARSEDSEIARILAQARAEAGQIKRTASDIYNATTLKSLDAVSAPDEVPDVQYRRSKDMAASSSSASGGRATAPECLSQHLALDKMQVPATAAEVQRLETLMWIAYEHMGLAMRYPSCLGAPTTADQWRQQYNAYARQCHAENGNRACTKTRHDF